MGLRRRSRERALQILYSIEFLENKDIQKAMDTYMEYFFIKGDTTPESEQEESDFVAYLLYQTLDHLEEIEKLIESAAINWRMNRIGIIERNILRLAVAELIDMKNGVPFKATINEAIDIAKKFGNKESSSFINGIINKVADVIDVKEKKL